VPEKVASGWVAGISRPSNQYFDLEDGWPKGKHPDAPGTQPQ